MIKVLLVDDEIFTIRMLQNIMPWAELGMQVVGYAQNGTEAYKKTVTERPDIIISDIRMPGMDGLEFIKKVRDFDSGIQTILMSAYADFSYVKEGIRLGCSDYILKPIDEVELEQVLQKVTQEIRGKKEQEKALQRSEERLGQMNLYQYMKTRYRKNNVWKSKRFSWMQGYCVYMLQLHNATIKEYDNSSNIQMDHEKYITSILEKLLLSYQRQFQIFDYEEGCWIIILGGGEDFKREDIAWDMDACMKKEAGLQMQISFSSIGGNIDELPALYDEVCNLSRYSFYVGDTNILGYGYNCKKEELDEVRHIDMIRELDFAEDSLQTGTYSKPVRESLQLIETKYDQNLSLEEICREIAVSKNYFSYLFKRETGMNLWNYLTTVRLQHAKQLLEETELKSYEIAFQVGYDNPSYFSKIFRKYENMTPNEYRESQGSK